jgi:hypothetical protein
LAGVVVRSGGVAYRDGYTATTGRRPVLHDLTYDDSEGPAIGLVPAGVSWAEVEDHIKIAHHPLLVLDEGGEYAGAYWAGTKLIVAEDLGADQDEAVGAFRELLRERGEA